MKSNQKRTRIRETRADRITLWIFYALLLLIGIITLSPVIFVVSASFSEPTAVNDGSVILWPVGFQIEGYQYIFENDWILTGYRNSLFYMVTGTLLDVAVTFFAAFALARKNLYGRAVLNWYMIIPMWFGGGLIPTFIVVNNLGLVDTWWVLIILGAFSTYNFIICRTFIMTSIPYELQEAAIIDGCTDFGILFKVVLPMSMPIIAILCLYYGLGHWNDYFTGLIYVNARDKQPLQVFLREILIQNAEMEISGDVDELEAMMRRMRMSQTMRYGLIVVSSLPMLMIYPFVQKYFVQGVLIGALKG